MHFGLTLALRGLLAQPQGVQRILHLLQHRLRVNPRRELLLLTH